MHDMPSGVAASASVNDASQEMDTDGPTSRPTCLKATPLSCTQDDQRH